MTAIHFAAMNDGYEICKLLTSTGINKDARTKVDRTPLHLAAFYGHERIVKLLVESQCALNPRDMVIFQLLDSYSSRHYNTIFFF